MIVMYKKFQYTMVILGSLVTLCAAGMDDGIRNNGTVIYVEQCRMCGLFFDSTHGFHDSDCRFYSVNEGHREPLDKFVREGRSNYELAMVLQQNGYLKCEI